MIKEETKILNIPMACDEITANLLKPRRIKTIKRTVLVKFGKILKLNEYHPILSCALIKERNA